MTQSHLTKERFLPPMKPTSRKKSKASKTKLQTVLTLDDFDFIIAAVSDASEDILQRNEAKQETMYERIEDRTERGTTSPSLQPRSVHCAPTIRRNRVGR
jgi:hypothetical protein